MNVLRCKKMEEPVDKIKDNLLQVLQKKEMNNNKKIRKKNCKDQIFQNKTQRFYKEAIII